MKKNIAIVILVLVIISMTSTMLLFQNVREGDGIIDENNTKVNLPIRRKQ